LVVRELRFLGIGLVLGICVVLATGQAAVPQEAGGPRYDVTAFRPEAGTYEFFVVDHRTNKVYHRRLGSSQIRQDGTPIEQIIADR
jgi:hypothetical protein